MSLIRFIGSALIASTVLVGASFYWPKLTGQQRPEALQKVYEAVLGTESGQKAAETLGATDETPLDPNALRQVGGEVVSQAATVVTKKVETVVVEKIIEELIKRYDILPTEEQEKVKVQICQ